MNSPRGFPNGFAMLQSPAQISVLIKTLTGSKGEFSLPLWRAALAGEVRVGYLVPGGRVPLRLLERTEPATVLILGGDPDNPAISPAAPEDFPQLKRLMAWSRALMILASGGKPSDYAAAASAGRIARRMLLIETCTARETAWIDVVVDEVFRRQPQDRLSPLLVSARPRGEYHPLFAGEGA